MEAVQVMEAVRVMLVEDDEADAEFVRRSLRKTPRGQFEIAHVATLSEASRELVNGRYDAVLLDLSLPDGDGLETLRATLRTVPDIPVVVLTGSDDDEMASASLRTGAQDYLVKGRENDVVARAIQYAIERKRSDIERRKVDERLSDVQKLESLGLLAGGLAHDFNNLLTGMLGHASLCLLRVPRGSVLEESLQQIERSAVRASDLCKQLLAYSGKGRFVVTAIDLSELVAEMVNMLQLSISSKAMLRCDLAENLPMFEAAATQVRQVVMNLITNASDSLGDDDGSITVSTGTMTCDNAYLATAQQLDPLPEGLYVYVEVSDTGCGMDAETLKQLFDPFFSTKGHGRGLGLAAVLGIMRSHKGALKVYTEPGKGSTIKVLFPASGATERGPARPSRSGKTTLEGTVLVADDEQAVRSVARSVLGAEGFEVVEAEDGVAAVSELRDRPGAIDLVLLDMTMPRLGGEETFRELRRIQPDVRVILSSGYNEQDAVAKFAGKGLAGFLQKPYSAQALMDAVRQALEE